MWNKKKIKGWVGIVTYENLCVDVAYGKVL